MKSALEVKIDSNIRLSEDTMVCEVKHVVAVWKYGGCNVYVLAKNQPKPHDVDGSSTIDLRTHDCTKVIESC